MRFKFIYRLLKRKNSIKQVRRELRGLLANIQDLKLEVECCKAMSSFTVLQNHSISNKIKCVFIVHAIESWDCQMDIWKKMLSDSRFKPIVISVDRHFPGDDGFGHEDITSSELDKLGIPHLRFGGEVANDALNLLISMEPDIIFRQSQWDDDYPEAFRTKNLIFTRLCSVPYGMSTVGEFRKGENPSSNISDKSYNTEWHRLCWRVFCENNITKRNFLHFNNLNPEKFVVSGYPKFDLLLHASKNLGTWPIECSKNNFRVIWAPHYSVGIKGLGFGTFDKNYNDFLSLAKNNPEIDFVLKPHPALFNQVISENKISKNELDNFISEWLDLDNCALSFGRYAELFAASDLMITDGISFLTEYQIFNKPIIYIDSGHHVKMNFIGDKSIAACHKLNMFDDVCKAIFYYKEGGEWHYGKQREELISILFPRKENSASIILDEIAEVLLVK